MIAERADGRRLAGFSGRRGCVPGRALRACLPALLLWAACCSGDAWQVFTECRLEESAANDGDSFLVRANRRQYVFRLYFVDAPETVTSFPERVREQAAYWNIGVEPCLETGRRAALFAAGFLKDGFTVYTRRIDARGSGRRRRYFAMVETGEGFLSEALVRNGLARIYGMYTDLPDGRPGYRFISELRAAEREARNAKRGAWGLAATGRAGSGGNDAGGAAREAEETP